MIATEIRKNARKSLSGKWNKGAIISFIVILFTVVVNLIATKTNENVILVNIISAIFVLIEVPLSVGVSYAFLELKRKKDAKIFDFIKLSIKNFAKSWLISWIIIFKMILPIICIIVASSLYLIMIFALEKMTLEIMLLGIFVFVIALAYSVSRGLLYTLSYYIAYDNPKMSLIKAVKESERLMSGHRGDYFVLILSFLGWAILSVLTVGVGTIWLAPYMQVSTVCFYEEILKLDKEKAKKADK